MVVLSKHQQIRSLLNKVALILENSLMKKSDRLSSNSDTFTAVPGWFAKCLYHKKKKTTHTEPHIHYTV